MNFSQYLIDQYGYNEPIFVNDIKFMGYSRPWIFKELKKLVAGGELKRFDTGVYYFPKKMFYGDSHLDPRKIIIRRFITDGYRIYGYVAGITLLTQIGLSTQMPNLIELVTNNESTRVRNIDVGNQRARVHRSRTSITKGNSKTLQFLDLMNSISPSSMDETDRYMLAKYIMASGVTRSDISQYMRYFPAKAVKSMMECGAVYELA